MQLLETLELRWFLEVNVGEAVDRWLFAPTPPQPVRSDAYLRTGRCDLGIKLRGTAGELVKVEIKYQLGSVPIDVLPGVRANLERWTKFSVASSGLESPRNGQWIRVEKHRRLRTFVLQAGRAAELGSQEQPESGCHVELARVRHDWNDQGADDAAAAWTLGLEAWGEAAQSPELLLASCRAVCVGDLPRALLSQRSQSYPAWLASL